MDCPETVLCKIRAGTAACPYGLLLGDSVVIATIALILRLLLAGDFGLVTHRPHFLSFIYRFVPYTVLFREGAQAEEHRLHR